MADKHPIITRAEAKAQGLKRYWTGLPCKYGHIAERITASGLCVECKRLADADYYKNNPDKVAAYKEKNKDKIVQQRKERYANEREEALEYSKNYRLAHLEEVRQKERENYHANNGIEKLRQWRAENREYVRERDRDYRARNVEKARARERRWREKHGDRARLIKLLIEHKRRARKLHALGSYIIEDVETLIAVQYFQCVYCGVDLNTVKQCIDHIHPLDRDGSNDKANIHIVCSYCNARKNAKFPLDFAAEIGMPLDKAPTGQTNEQYRATQR